MHGQKNKSARVKDARAKRQKNKSAQRCKGIGYFGERYNARVQEKRVKGERAHESKCKSTML